MPIGFFLILTPIVLGLGVASKRVFARKFHYNSPEYLTAAALVSLVFPVLMALFLIAVSLTNPVFKELASQQHSPLGITLEILWAWLPQMFFSFIGTFYPFLSQRWQAECTALRDYCSALVAILNSLIILWIIIAPLELHQRGCSDCGMAVGIDAIMFVLPASLLTLALAFLVLRTKSARIFSTFSFLFLLCAALLDLLL